MSVHDLAATRVAIPGTSNVRDLGGYPIAQGAVIAPRRLYRSEALSYPGGDVLQAVWDAKQSESYAALGLRTVVDLRSVHETRASPSAWAAATGAEVVALPIEEGGEGTDTNFVRRIICGEMSSFGPAEMAQFYCDTVDRRIGVFIAATRVLADPLRVPALLHCSAGKDRTGMVVAVLLEALGADRGLVVDDYALTEVLRPDRVDAYRPRLEAAGVDADAVRVLFETPARAMELMLEHLDETFGGAAAYLASGGLGAAELDRVRDNLAADVTVAR